MNNALLMTKECVLREIEKINNRGEMTNADLDNLMKATKVLVNIDGIKGMEEYSDQNFYGYSKGVLPRMESHMPSYGPHMGHMGPSYGGYYGNTQYEQGHSNHSIEDRMIANLEQQMDMAKTDYERQTIMREIQHIREQQNK